MNYTEEQLKVELEATKLELHLAQKELMSLEKGDEPKAKLHQLEEKIRRQKGMITDYQRVICEWKKRFHAMHWIWCDGGCESNKDVTWEDVKIVEHNLKRMKSYLHNREFRIKHKSNNLLTFVCLVIGVIVALLIAAILT